MTTPRRTSPAAPARVVPERQVQGERWEIVLSGHHPVTLNRLLGCHWAIAAKRKKGWMRAIGLFSAHVPKATGKRRVSLKVTLAPRQRAFDPDATTKASSDSLILLMFGRRVDMIVRTGGRIRALPPVLNTTTSGGSRHVCRALYHSENQFAISNPNQDWR